MKKLILTTVLMFISVQSMAGFGFNTNIITNPPSHFKDYVECINCSLTEMEDAAVSKKRRHRDGLIFVFDYENRILKKYLVQSTYFPATGHEDLIITIIRNFRDDSEVIENLGELWDQGILSDDIVIPEGTFWGFTDLSTAYNVIDCPACVHDLSWWYVGQRSWLTNLRIDIQNVAAYFNRQTFIPPFEVTFHFSDGTKVTLRSIIEFGADNIIYEVVEGTFKDSRGNTLPSSGGTTYLGLQNSIALEELMRRLRESGFTIGDTTGPNSCSFSCNAQLICRLQCGPGPGG